jgi:two-component system, cell cycle sensor histidine kinase and response regulator CckA
VPLLYALVASAWIAFSDVLIAQAAGSIREHTAYSLVKGLAFVVVTALLLHLALRRGLARERDVHRRLAASEALLRNITDAIPDPIFLKDREGKWIFCNPATLEVVGKPSDRVIGKTDAEIYDDPQIGRALMETDRRIMDAGITEVVEERIQTGKGYRVFLSTKAVQRDLEGGAIGIIGVARDITDRKQAEESLRQSTAEQRRLEQQFQEAQKLESVGRLAGGIAHDFNNLLTVILSCAEALQDDLGRGLPPKLEELHEIRAAGRRATELTRQLLAFGRRQVIAPVPLDLNAVVRGTERLLRRILGEDVEVLVNLEPALWNVRCDRGQVEQVILNLAVNARDAMPGGGRFLVATGNARLGPEDDARLTVEQPGEFVMLVVRDSGTGMSPEVKEHAFEPFFTTKREGEGTGLGLATVYGIVKQNAGHLQLTSAPGEGTAFQIYLPRTLDPVVEVQASPASRTSRGSETILVVEDDPQVREVTVRSLRAGGYQVLVAASGRDALQIDPSELGRVRLLVTDVIMPGLDGPSLARELCRRHPALRVLYVSGYTQDAIAEHGVLAPGIELLHKPFTPSLLLARTRAVLDAP